MTTELVWSTVKPTFEEVKGKKVKVISLFPNGDLESNLVTINSDTTYGVMFDEDFICYADLTATVSPLPLWGKLPEMITDYAPATAPVDRYGKVDDSIVAYGSLPRYYMEYVSENDYDWWISTPEYFTTAEAILAWNRIAEALEKVER